MDHRPTARDRRRNRQSAIGNRKSKIPRLLSSQPIPDGTWRAHLHPARSQVPPLPGLQTLLRVPKPAHKRFSESRQTTDRHGPALRRVCRRKRRQFSRSPTPRRRRERASLGISKHRIERCPKRCRLRRRRTSRLCTERTQVTLHHQTHHHSLPHHSRRLPTKQRSGGSAERRKLASASLASTVQTPKTLLPERAQKDFEFAPAAGSQIVNDTLKNC